MHPLRHTAVVQSLLCSVCLYLSLMGATRAQETDYLDDMPLNQLLQTEPSPQSKVVSTPSRQNQKITESAASVSIITADDIRTYGYRTLADVLNSVRGFYIANDGMYSSAGVRGFLRPGDYSSRILLMVDGYRINDNIYDAGSFGQELLVDMEMVKRVEIIRGPSSSLYGSNALLGVINIITRNAQDIGNGEASASVQGRHEGKLRASLGKQYDNGLSMLLSASQYDDRGRSQQLPEATFQTPEYNFGRVDAGSDYTHARTVMAKLAWQAWRFETYHAQRDKGIGNALSGTLLNYPNNKMIDEEGIVGLRYKSGNADQQSELSARLFYGYYNFFGTYQYPDPIMPAFTTADEAKGSWWGTEANWSKKWHSRNTLVTGFNWQTNTRQNQSYFNVMPFESLLDDKYSSKRYGVYLQNDWQVLNNLTLSIGARADKYSGNQAVASPRLSVVYQPQADHFIKLMYGSAFRVPNAYESRYETPSYQMGNPHLHPEYVKTLELIDEFSLNQTTHLTLSAFMIRMKDILEQKIVDNHGAPILQFQNYDKVKTNGFEAEINHQWHSGAKIRSSVSYQSSHEDDDGANIANSPRWMMKVNYSLPFLQNQWRAGLELQTMSNRIAKDTFDNSIKLPRVSRTNLTFLRPALNQGIEWSLSIYNLFNRNYADPVGADPSIPERAFQQQDGRRWMGRMIYRF